MKFCNAKKISNQQCYNNEYAVVSVHKSIELALKARDDREIMATIEVADDIKVGDSINDSGKDWLVG